MISPVSLMVRRVLAVAALLHRELRLSELVVEELQLEVLAGVVGDRVDLVEELTKALGLEPMKGLDLCRYEVLQLDQVRDTAITKTRGSSHL
ncbi:MAG: hypothetical protein E6J37_12545 [Chloroflexi bacterium]|nr:MAG: hypothetical protein E6J37_12545 [Chloroflexota bacterium]